MHSCTASLFDWVVWLLKARHCYLRRDSNTSNSFLTSGSGESVLYFYGLETSVCVLTKADRAAHSMSVLRAKDG